MLKLVNKYLIQIACVIVVAVISITPSWALMKVETVETAIGPTAWLIEDHELPIITISLMWRGGTAQDPEQKLGLTTLMASLMNEGAGSYDSRAFQDRMAFLGTEINFRADHDALSAEIRLLRRHRNESFALLREALTVPRFDDEAITRMKYELGTIIQRRQADPGDRASDLWFERAFTGHPYAHITAGTMAGLQNIDADDLRQRHRDLVARNNLMISAFGDISARELKAVLEEILSALPATHSAPSIAPYPLTASGLHVEPFQGPQSAVVFGLPGIAIGEDDFFPSYILNYILGGGGFSSRLVEEVREKRGLTYSIYSYLQDNEAGPLWLGGFTSDRSTVEEALDLVKTEMTQLQKEGVSAAELADAKTHIQGSYVLGFDSGLNIVHQMGFAQWHSLPPTYFKERNQRVEAVSLEAVNRVAKQRLDPEKLLIQIVGAPTTD